MAVEQDPLEEHLLDSSEGARSTASRPFRNPRRCPRSGARRSTAAGRTTPPGGSRRTVAPSHDRLRRSRVERGRRPRAASRRPCAPALSLGRLLSRPGRAGGDRRRPGRDARRRRCGCEPIAGGRHKVFGRRELSIVPMTSTIASHLPRSVGWRSRSIALRAGLVPVAAGCDRALLVRRRLAEPRERAGGSQHCCALRLPGPAASASLPVRGQRPRAQRADARRVGGGSASISARAALPATGGQRPSRRAESTRELRTGCAASESRPCSISARCAT